MAQTEILTIKREETKTLIKGDAFRVHPSTHTHTRESQSSVRSNYLKEWIQWFWHLSPFTHTQPSVRPMKRGLLHQGWYWVLVFLVTTPTARPAPGCYTWFQVGVMWPLCSPCSKRTYVTGFTAVADGAVTIRSCFCTLIAAACRPARCCKYIICGGSNWLDVPPFTHCIFWSTACPICVMCRIYVVSNWCERNYGNWIRFLCSTTASK